MRWRGGHRQREKCPSERESAPKARHLRATFAPQSRRERAMNAPFCPTIAPGNTGLAPGGATGRQSGESGCQGTAAARPGRQAYSNKRLLWKPRPKGYPAMDACLRHSAAALVMELHVGDTAEGRAELERLAAGRGAVAEAARWHLEHWEGAARPPAERVHPLPTAMRSRRARARWWRGQTTIGRGRRRGIALDRSLAVRQTHGRSGA